MAFSTKQRQWFLGVAFALTLAAMASLEGNNESDMAVARPDKSKLPNLKKNGGAESELAGDVALAKLNRQPLSEDVKEMFAGKSWYVAPPPPKVVIPTAPPLPFVFKGKLAEEGEKIAVFLNKQGRSYIVREGDVLDKNYSVDEVRPPVMTLTYLPLNIKQTIQIGELN